MFDIAEFREAFPEFKDVGVYPDSAILFWNAIAEGVVSESKFGSLYKKVLYLVTAHYLGLASRGGAASGASAGGQVIASKKVGDVAISYDNSSSAVADAGQWNDSVYGKQFLSLQRIFGAGCKQL